MYCSIYNTPIKPKIIFYGECLLLSFLLQFAFTFRCDFAFIMGTSLKVSPFNHLPDKWSSGSWRIFVNKEEIDCIFRFDNVFNKVLFLGGYTDQIIEQIVKNVGWEHDFKNYCEYILKNL